MTEEQRIREAYARAQQRYAELEVDTEAAMAALDATPISLQCWQGDDVVGFEQKSGVSDGGGIQVTGGYPGRARSLQELRTDLEAALALIPGRHRVNLHAMYGDFAGKRVERDQILPEHFAGWVDWARQRRVGLDFNATCFAHPQANSGLTLSSPDRSIRTFWIEHVRRSREISAFMGRGTGTPCMHDLWIPDGTKDLTVSRSLLRGLLKESLDAIYEASFPRTEMKDAVECKLFGIGSESFVVGSHEFYLSYVHGKDLLLCLDMGHFHPTESVADKISAILPFVPEMLIHVSRGVRWDSDHVVIFNDDLRALAEEIIRAGALPRVHLALDFFDASINRVGAWVIGARATQKALLSALLEPIRKLRALEEAGNGFARLAYLEEAKTLPMGDVWNYHCLKQGVPAGTEWITSIERYEQKVLSLR